MLLLREERENQSFRSDGRGCQSAFLYGGVLRVWVEAVIGGIV